jgi:transcriptional regulator with XRE-family HTH domain
MYKKNITGQRIKKARKGVKITQMELAARLQVLVVMIDRSGIAKIETGRRPVSDIEIAAIAKILDIEVAWLFKDSETLLNNLSE